MKRIHKPACPAAADAVRNTGIMNQSGFLCLFAAIFGDGRCVKRRRGDFVRGRLDGGTLIHNGNCRQPSSICSLAVPLVESPFRSAPMTEICSSTLLPPRFAPATLVAILLAAVTPAANPEYGAAPMCPANPLPENVFSRLSHSHPKARLDNGCRSWQLIGGCVDNLSIERYRQ